MFRVTSISLLLMFMASPCSIALGQEPPAEAAPADTAPKAEAAAPEEAGMPELEKAKAMMEDPAIMHMLQTQPWMVQDLRQQGIDPEKLMKEQEEWSKKLQALPLPENATEEQVLEFLKQVKAMLEQMPGRQTGFFGMHGDPLVAALGKLQPQHVPLLLRKPYLLSPYQMRSGLRSMDLEEHKELLIQAAQDEPVLFELVIQKGWGGEVVETMLARFDELQSSDTKERAVSLAIEHWKPEYEDFVRKLLTSRREESLMIFTLERLSLVSPELQDEMVELLWLQRDALDLQDERLAELAMLAFFNGEPEAVIPVLAEVDRKLKEENHYSRLLGDNSPAIMERFIQSALGKVLPAGELLEWLRVHRKQLVFDRLTRRYLLQEPTTAP